MGKAKRLSLKDSETGDEVRIYILYLDSPIPPAALNELQELARSEKLKVVTGSSSHNVSLVGPYKQGTLARKVKSIMTKYYPLSLIWPYQQTLSGDA